MHKTATTLNAFDHPSWQAFFTHAVPGWSPPSPEAVGNHLLIELYEKGVQLAFQDLLTAAAVIIGMEVATNVLSSSMSKIIADTPRPWFLKYLRAVLKKGLADELLDA